MNDLLDTSAAQRKRLRRIIMLVILISIGVHVLFGIGAGIWVIARYFTQPKAQFVAQKTVNMEPEERKHRLAMSEVESIRPKPVYNNRIQSLRPSTLALPDLPKLPVDTSVPLDTESLVSDQMEGIGGSAGAGSGTGGGFFGGTGNAGSGLLAGNLYDLKKDAQGQPVQMDNTTYLDVINKLSRSGSTESALRRFYRAPDTLYMPRVAIPVINANEAPKAFKVDGKVQPKYWVAVYRGRMIAPESGSFKFLGFADDILLVKINDRLVLDGSLLGATRLHKREGLSFSVEKGKAYDIEVIVGECPGGYFNAWLQLQKQGSGDKPYWFRMNDEKITYTSRTGDGQQQNPPSTVNGPVWWPAPVKASTKAPIGL